MTDGGAKVVEGREEEEMGTLLREERSPRTDREERMEEELDRDILARKDEVETCERERERERERSPTLW